MSASVRGIGVAVMTEHVWASPFHERGALGDAEAVLLVDDGDREVAEVDLLLDERVRPDDDLGVPRCDELPRGGVLVRPEELVSSSDPDARAARRARRW